VVPLICQALCRNGRYEEVLKLISGCMTEVERVIGRKNLNTIQIRCFESDAFFSIQKYADSVKTLSNIPQLTKAELPEEHPVSLKLLTTLAKSLGCQGLRKQELEIYNQVLPIHLSVLGPEHPETEEILHNKASTLMIDGRLNDAWDWAEKVYAVFEVIGNKEASILSIKNIMAVILGRAGQLEEAIAIHISVYETRRRLLGEEHPLTLLALRCILLTKDKLDQKRASTRSRPRLSI